MAETTLTRAQSRRDALAAFGATGLVGLAVAGLAKPERLTSPPIHRDTDLLCLVAAHSAIERERDALATRWGHVLHVPLPVQYEADTLHREAETLRGRIAAIPARTAEGRAAKAQIAAELLSEFSPADLSSTGRLLLSLCCDLQAGGRA